MTVAAAVVEMEMEARVLLGAAAAVLVTGATATAATVEAAGVTTAAAATAGVTTGVTAAAAAGVPVTLTTLAPVATEPLLGSALRVLPAGNSVSSI